MSFASRIGRLACLMALLVATDFAVAAVAHDRLATGGGVGTSDPAGSLVICGGGELHASLFAEFLERAGGDEAHLVVIPTASRKPEKLDPETIRATWRVRGARSLAVLHTRSRKEANRESFVAPLKRATGVWLGGGVQSRLADAYVGTAVERELYALHARGGVIGGTSAGAAIQSRTMITGGNPDAKIGLGFDLLRGSVIDQHFLKRNRKRRLTGVLRNHPGLVGFGIDEGTALIVTGRRLRVLGESTVTVIFAPFGSQAVTEIELESGDTADLTALRQAARELARPASRIIAPHTPPGRLELR